MKWLGDEPGDVGKSLSTDEILVGFSLLDGTPLWSTTLSDLLDKKDAQIAELNALADELAKDAADELYCGTKIHDGATFDEFAQELKANRLQEIRKVKP